jgi:NTE family protein
MTRVHRASDLLEPNNLRWFFLAKSWLDDFFLSVRDDTKLLTRLAAALSGWGPDEPQRFSEPLFPERRPLRVPALEGKRIALVASGGSGATASLCGVRRAFEEADLQVVVLSACSGSMLFASLWAAGFDAEQMGRFWLGVKRRDYLDPDHTKLWQAAWRGFSRFGGLMPGDALESTLKRILGDMTLAQTRVPVSAVVWNIDENRVEHLGSDTTPELTLARAARAAVSIPVFFEPVQLGQHLYGDGGIVDIFPIAALRMHQPIDVVFGVNCYLAEDFSSEDITGWRNRRFAILRASGQLRFSGLLQLAREHAAALGERLILLTPVSHNEVRGAHFYDSFIDRRDWPRYMRQGYECTRAKLESIARSGLSA